MSTKSQKRRPRPRAHQHERTGGKARGVGERILDAALNILAESGLQHLTQLQVANRAGVRQSHLTYYFPTRDDLLSAVTERAVDGIAAGFRQMVTDGVKGKQKPLVERLARSVADLAHMRMFVAMIVEADADPAVRSVMRRATERIEAALAEALGGDRALERARLVLAAVWGLGLYQFLMRPASKADPTRAYLAWLTEASTGHETAGARRLHEE